MGRGQHQQHADSYFQHLLPAWLPLPSSASLAGNQARKKESAGCSCGFQTAGFPEEQPLTVPSWSLTQL